MSKFESKKTNNKTFNTTKQPTTPTEGFLSQNNSTTSFNAQKSGSGNNEKYSFDLSTDGQVTGAYEMSGSGVLKAEKIKTNKTFQVNGDLIIKTEVEKNKTEWTAYADSDHDGLYTEIREGYGTVDLMGLSTFVNDQVALGATF